MASLLIFFVMGVLLIFVALTVFAIIGNIGTILQGIPPCKTHDWNEHPTEGLVCATCKKNFRQILDI